ncbi:MAG: hypothetical protein OXH52_02770 [Gammaproteobacteria bacterium]|nr:hypothetical protein [Gammaproteobacteria bacterium]
MTPTRPKYPIPVRVTPTSMAPNKVWVNVRVAVALPPSFVVAVVSRPSGS